MIFIHHLEFLSFLYLFEWIIFFKKLTRFLFFTYYASSYFSRKYGRKCTLCSKIRLIFLQKCLKKLHSSSVSFSNIQIGVDVSVNTTNCIHLSSLYLQTNISYFTTSAKLYVKNPIHKNIYELHSNITSLAKLKIFLYEAYDSISGLYKS